jgi:hypothetical protein
MAPEIVVTTSKGIALGLPPKFCLVVCENFQREVAAVVAQKGFDAVRVRSFPATCIRPADRADAPISVVNLATARGEDVVALGGYCLRQLAEADCQSGRLRVCRRESCLELAASDDLIQALVSQGAYLLTPGWLVHWPRYMAEWGFDQKTAREFFAESIRKLILFDTGCYHESAAHLQTLADFLALPCEVVPVGLELFRLQITNLIQSHLTEMASSA